MRNWKIKALIQGGISFLPKSQSWNYLFQKYLSKSLKLDEEKLLKKLAQSAKHLENYFEAADKPERDLFVLELGTGWWPIVPIGLFLSGATWVWTLDKNSLLDHLTIKTLLNLITRVAEDGRLSRVLPRLSRNRLVSLTEVSEDESLSDTEALLKRLRITAVVGNGHNLGLEKKIDLFVSNNTLEHIHSAALREIFIEFSRLSSADAVMSHFIDLSDHYANFDKTISPHNFLKFSDFTWRIFNNSVHFQNRLRISDFKKIQREAGFGVVMEETAKTGVDIKDVALAERFRDYPESELLATHSWLVSKLEREINPAKV